MTHRLVLIRHAKAEQSAPTDTERPLAPRGHADARALGAWLAERGHRPDLAVLSPAVRTRETWDDVAAALSPPPRIAVEDRLYAASVPTLLDVIRSLDDGVDAAAVVGHNPGIGELAHLLAGDEARRWGDGYPTATAAVLEVAGGWAELDTTTARFIDALTARAAS